MKKTNPITDSLLEIAKLDLQFEIDKSYEILRDKLSKDEFEFIMSDLAVDVRAMQFELGEDMTFLGCALLLSIPDKTFDEEEKKNHKELSLHLKALIKWNMLNENNNSWIKNL